MRIWARKELIWKGSDLYAKGRTKPLISVVPDDKWPGMWRVKYPDGTLSDMVNISWAKDAAAVIGLQILNSQETPSGAPRTAISEQAA